MKTVPSGWRHGIDGKIIGLAGCDRDLLFDGPPLVCLALVVGKCHGRALLAVGYPMIAVVGEITVTDQLDRDDHAAVFHQLEAIEPDVASITHQL